MRRIVLLLIFLFLFLVIPLPAQAQLANAKDPVNGVCTDPSYPAATNNSGKCCPADKPFYCGAGPQQSNGLCGATQASCFGQPGAYNGPCNSDNTCNDPTLTCDTAVNKCLVKNGTLCFANNFQYQCASPNICETNPANVSQQVCLSPTPTQSAQVQPGAQDPYLTPYNPPVTSLLKQAAIVAVIAAAIFFVFS